MNVFTFINQVFQWKTLVIKMMNVSGRAGSWDEVLPSLEWIQITKSVL